MAVKLGIIGFGYMAHWHANNSRKIQGLEVVAAYDIDPERVRDAREFGLKGYDTLEDFLRDPEISLVLVATPNEVHPELVCAALNAGKHVVCEKPVALSVAELDQMIETAETNHRLFTIHQNRRWDKDYVTAKAVYQSGVLGNVYSIQSRLHGMGGAMFGWRSEKAHGGGMLYDWGVHFLDQIYDLLGYDNLLSVKCHTHSVKTKEVDDYFHLTLDTRQGVLVVVEIGTFVLRESPRWLMLGDEGTMYIDDFQASGGIVKVNTFVEQTSIVVETSSGPTRTFAPRPKEVKAESPLPPQDPQWVEFYQNVRDVIEGDAKELIVQPWQARKVLHLIECAFESARTGKQVEL